MAQFNVISQWTLDKEGGLSRAKTDWAAKYPAPCSITYRGTTASDWHTNKGIQWITFKEHAPKFGYTVNCENFVQMPYDLWSKIAKRVYWDAYSLDNLQSQAIANLLFQSGWGSGLSGSLKFWNGYFQKGFTTNTQVTEYVKELLKKQPERILFDSMWKARLNWLLSIPGNEANYAGWEKRANDLKAISEPYLAKGQTAAISGNSILAALALLIAWKVGEKMAKR